MTGARKRRRRRGCTRRPRAASQGGSRRGSDEAADGPPAATPSRRPRKGRSTSCGRPLSALEGARVAVEKVEQIAVDAGAAVLFTEPPIVAQPSTQPGRRHLQRVEDLAGQVFVLDRL